MNDTPETDATYKNHPWDMHDHIPLEFARRLERERDDAREVLREIRDNEVNPEDEADKFLRDHVPSELSKVREQRDSIDSMYQKIIKEVLECDPIPACKREDDQLEPPWEVIARTREQRDRLAEALRKLADCDWVITLPNRMDAVRTIADVALKSLTP